MPTISQALANECASLIWRKWAEACDNLKAVKSEKNDGSKDWLQFHMTRLRQAVNEEAKFKAFLDEIKPLHTIGGAGP